MYLIAGLGNPGEKYQNNRHNVGFLLIDYLKTQYQLDQYTKKKNFLYIKTRLYEKDVLLMKPITFMNLSGLGLLSAVTFFKISLDHIIVVYDDVALPLGMIRIREKGSAGGHNGLKNIQSQFGSQNYTRIRIGIDAPKYTSAMKSYVLGNFSPEEREKLGTDVFNKIDQALSLMVNHKIKEAMNQFNERISQ